ncbi:MAG: four helix bundle protein [Lentimicrobium sp.]|nr:four helix bundle protein [Lentimicrobium sp.]
MSYKKLEIWERAREVSIAIHKMTITELPKYEMYEEGSQIRRSSKSIRSNIVEGYGRRRYVMEYIRFLTFSIASNDESIDHLETLFETGSLENKIVYEDIHEKLEILGKKLNLFIQAIERNLHQQQENGNK